jgi:hypothetical protein
MGFEMLGSKTTHIMVEDALPLGTALLLPIDEDPAISASFS